MPDPDIESLEDTESAARAALSEAEQLNLSKALFPDTHTDEVMVLGESRTLRPLPIKYARQLHSILQPITAKIQKESVAEPEKRSNVNVDLELLDACLKAALILCKFYEWDDLTEKLKEELVEFDEVQALLVQQAALQKANDFLLTPLRVAVGTMRIVETNTLQYLSTFNGLHSSNNTDVLSKA